MKNGLNVKIWGTRGSMAAPYPDRMVYGANTSCVSVEWEDGIAVFDCGTGIRGFGEELSKRSDMEKKELHIFISHLHLDHIIGLPFCHRFIRKTGVYIFTALQKQEPRFVSVFVLPQGRLTGRLL